MKKILFSTLLVALTAVLMTGCKKDDDGNGGGTLVGRWEAIEEINEPDWSDLDYEYEPGEEILEFSSDGKLTTYYEGEEESTAIYVVKGNELYVMGMLWGRFEVSGNTLKIHSKSIDINPISSTTIYKRIK